MGLSQGVNEAHCGGQMADGYLVEETQVTLFPGLELIIFRPEEVVFSARFRQSSTVTARHLQVAAIALSNC